MTEEELEKGKMRPADIDQDMKVRRGDEEKGKIRPTDIDQEIKVTSGR